MSGSEERIPEEDDTTEAPLTMAASVVLTNLPRDASKALETAGNLTVQKSKPLASRLHLEHIPP
jgi:ubiquitin-like protein ATG12